MVLLQAFEWQPSFVMFTRRQPFITIVHRNEEQIIGRSSSLRLNALKLTLVTMGVRTNVPSCGVLEDLSRIKGAVGLGVRTSVRDEKQRQVTV
jgi:hypothetical protein